MNASSVKCECSTLGAVAIANFAQIPLNYAFTFFCLTYLSYFLMSYDIKTGIVHIQRHKDRSPENSFIQKVKVLKRC